MSHGHMKLDGLLRMDGGADTFRADKSAPTDVRMSLLTWISNRHQGRGGLVLRSLLSYLLLHQLPRVLIGRPFNR
jgi:hypothetical protein